MTTAPEPKPKPEGDGVNLELLITKLQQKINHVIFQKQQRRSIYQRRMKEVGYTVLQQINLLGMAEMRYRRDLYNYQNNRLCTITI